MVTVLPPFDAWAGTTVGADTIAAMRTMRTPKVRIKSLTGAKRRELVEFICRFSFHSEIRHGVTPPACGEQAGTTSTVSSDAQESLTLGLSAAYTMKTGISRGGG